MSFLDSNSEDLKSFAQMSQKIGARNDYVQGGGGNTSVKLKGDLMAIKASGYCLSDIREDSAYAVLNYAELREYFAPENLKKTKDVEAEGSQKTKSCIVKPEGLAVLRPSVEAGFHAVLDKYVIHTHSIYANMAACAKECDEILKKALNNADYDYTVIAYKNPGSRLAFEFSAALERKRAEVIFMQNHGVVVHGSDWEKCVLIHEDLNKRLAAYFNADFKILQVEEIGENKLRLHGLEGVFASEEAAREKLILEPLFPDQLVFLGENVQISREEPVEGMCTLDISSSTIQYDISKKRAMVIAEVILAVSCIIRAVHDSGNTIQVMEERQKSFINNWESEKYRKLIHER